MDIQHFTCEFSPSEEKAVSNYRVDDSPNKNCQAILISSDSMLCPRIPSKFDLNDKSESKLWNCTCAVEHSLGFSLRVMEAMRSLQKMDKEFLTIEDIVDYIQVNYRASGDIYSQVRTTLQDICHRGFVMELMKNEYRFIGPIVSLMNDLDNDRSKTQTENSDNRRSSLELNFNYQKRPISSNYRSESLKRSRLKTSCPNSRHSSGHPVSSTRRRPKCLASRPANLFSFERAMPQTANNHRKENFFNIRETSQHRSSFIRNRDPTRSTHLPMNRKNSQQGSALINNIPWETNREWSHRKSSGSSVSRRNDSLFSQNSILHEESRNVVEAPSVIRQERATTFHCCLCDGCAAIGFCNCAHDNGYNKTQLYNFHSKGCRRPVSDICRNKLRTRLHHNERLRKQKPSYNFNDKLSNGSDSVYQLSQDLCSYDSCLPSQDYDYNNTDNFSNCSVFAPRAESFTVSQSTTSSITSDFLQPPVLVKLPSLMRSISVAQPMLNSPNIASASTLMTRRFVNGSSSNSSVHRRPRSEKKPIPEHQKDQKYYERRKRNNQAAKKSRDARKIREDHIALRATMLEHENTILKAQIIALRNEAQSLRHLLIKQQGTSGIRNAGRSVSISITSTNTIASTTPGLSTLAP